jgi:hypothetical protein
MCIEVPFRSYGAWTDLWSGSYKASAPTELNAYPEN